MRRIGFLLLGLLLAACGETVLTGEEMVAPSIDVPPVDAGPDADLEPVESTVVPRSTVASVEQPTTTSVPEPIPTGREALAANAGKPHVLWFWGAH